MADVGSVDLAGVGVDGVARQHAEALDSHTQDIVSTPFILCPAVLATIKVSHGCWRVRTGAKAVVWPLGM